MDNQKNDGGKKSHQVLKIFAIAGGILIFLGILISSATQSQNNSNSTVAQNTNLSVVGQACQGYDSNNSQAIDYKQLEKDPSSFQGQSTKFVGQVLQIQESNGEGYIRLAVDKDQYGWNMGDVVLVRYEGHTDAVVDDVVTVTGVMEGDQTYTSQANFKITVPLMYGCSITKNTPTTSVQPTQKTTTTKTNTNSQSQTSTSNDSQTQTTSQPSQTQTTYTTPSGAVINQSGGVVSQPASWHTAYTYSGSTNVKTPPFSLQGKQWRITYSCSTLDTNISTSNFFGQIKSATGGSGYDAFADMSPCPGNNTSYSYSNSPDQYYLDIGPVNASFTVTVEDYY